MSDEGGLNQIEITQSGRRYHWQVQNVPISRTEIETQSAHMHLIPATNTIESMIKQAKQGQIIEMRGCPVRVDASG
jgi:hydrogenase maturation factor HypF (carbamoyltransferase family)